MTKHELYQELKRLSRAELLTYVQNFGPLNAEETWVFETVVLRKLHDRNDPWSVEDTDAAFREAPLKFW